MTIQLMAPVQGTVGYHCIVLINLFKTPDMSSLQNEQHIWSLEQVEGINFHSGLTFCRQYTLQNYLSYKAYVICTGHVYIYIYKT